MGLDHFHESACLIGRRRVGDRTPNCGGRRDALLVVHVVDAAGRRTALVQGHRLSARRDVIAHLHIAGAVVPLAVAAGYDDDPQNPRRRVPQKGRHWPPKKRKTKRIFKKTLEAKVSSVAKRRRQRTPRKKKKRPHPSEVGRQLKVVRPMRSP